MTPEFHSLARAIPLGARQLVRIWVGIACYCLLLNACAAAIRHRISPSSKRRGAMKPLQLFCVALTSTALLACQEDPTQPRQDVSLLGTYAVLAPTSTINATAPVHLHPPAGEV